LLNRVIEWTDTGIRYEADQRHADIIVAHLGLQNESRSLSIPGTKDETPGTTGSEDLLSQSLATQYRALTARGIYLSQDRCDVSYSVKELARHMSKPRECDFVRLKRLGRYLIGRERYVVTFVYQDHVLVVTSWVDSDWAGCRETRKSTSGGVTMLNNHPLKHWSSTQGVIALSSGEAEYYAIVKGASQAFGIASMLADVGVTCKVIVKSDASAAKGIASRSGLGKVRHIDVSQLWVQDKVRSKDMIIEKVKTFNNLADIFTKYVGCDTIVRHVKGLYGAIELGRHALMPYM
jgi:hypothetical protein